jgi:hypothetical protein
MKTLSKIVILVGTLCAGGVALADEAKSETPNLVTPYGMAGYVGGGVGGFVDSGMRDFAGTAGLWEARFQFGTRLPIGFEAAYLGGLSSVSNSLGIDKDARLLSNGAEATLRVNILTGMIEPYVFAGAGWTRYDMTGYDTRTADVAETDDVFTIPVGLGVGYRLDRMLADLRGTYRPAFDEDLVLKTGSTDHQNMDAWQVTLHAGFEF